MGISVSNFTLIVLYVCALRVQGPLKLLAMTLVVLVLMVALAVVLAMAVLAVMVRRWKKMLLVPLVKVLIRNQHRFCSSENRRCVAQMTLAQAGEELPATTTTPRIQLAPTDAEHNG